MGLQTYIPEELCDDDVVCYLADRYHTAPREVLRCFLAQSGHSAEPYEGTFRLEDNEMAILRDMIRENHS